MEKTGDVAGTATEGARDVAAVATRQASDLTKEAAAQARSLASETTDQLRENAGQQTERAASGLRSLSEQVRALSEGRTDEAGAAGDYVRQAGDKLRQVAERLEDGGLDGLVGDLQGFARRQPGLFLVGAAGAGFLAGRMLRGAQAVSSESGGGQQVATSEEPELRLGRAGGPLVTPGAPTAQVGTGGKAGGLLGAGGFAGYMALLFLSFAGAWLLDEVMHVALAFLIVGVLYAVVAAALVSSGRSRMKDVNPVPQQTVETLKEDVQWAKAQRN